MYKSVLMQPCRHVASLLVVNFVSQMDKKFADKMICVELLQRYFHFISLLTSRYLRPIVLSWIIYLFIHLLRRGGCIMHIMELCIVLTSPSYIYFALKGSSFPTSLGRSVHPFLFTNQPVQPCCRWNLTSPLIRISDQHCEEPPKLSRLNYVIVH